MIEELPPLTFNGDIVLCFHFFNQKIGVTIVLGKHITHCLVTSPFLQHILIVLYIQQLQYKLLKFTSFQHIFRHCNGTYAFSYSKICSVQSFLDFVNAVVFIEHPQQNLVFSNCPSLITVIWLCRNV